MPTGPRGPTASGEESETTGTRTRVLPSGGRRRRVKATKPPTVAADIAEEDRRSATFNRGNRIPAGDGLTGVRRRVPTGGRRRIRPLSKDFRNQQRNKDNEDEESEEEEDEGAQFSAPAVTGPGRPAPNVQISTVRYFLYNSVLMITNT